MNDLEKSIYVIVAQIFGFLFSYCVFNALGFAQAQPDLILVLSLMNSVLIAVITIGIIGDKP